MFEPEFNDWMNIVMLSNFAYFANIYSYIVAPILILYAKVAGLRKSIFLYVFLTVFKSAKIS